MLHTAQFKMQLLNNHRSLFHILEIKPCGLGSRIGDMEAFLIPNRNQNHLLNSIHVVEFYPSKCYLATLLVCSTQQQQYSVLRMLLIIQPQLWEHWPLSFLFEVLAQIWLDPLRGFWGCWTTFIKNLFQKICSFKLSNPLEEVFWPFLASNSLNNLRGQK